MVENPFNHPHKFRATATPVLVMMNWNQTTRSVLTVNVFFFLLGGGAADSGVVWYLSFEPLANGELVRLLACSSSESISSCRRRRALFASTFGDSQFDIEFGSIFDTPNFTLPINDCVSHKWRAKKRRRRSTTFYRIAYKRIFILHYINNCLATERFFIVQS